MPCRIAIVAAILVPALALSAGPPDVVELFEDDAKGLLEQISHGGIGGGEANRADPETTDVFSGKTAVRVAGLQRFSPDIKGWDFSITEKPKAGEYRYLRFAWKKCAPGGPLMIQFHTRSPRQDWFIRYYMGPGPPWESKILGAAAPTEWVVVTRDLFADFGAFSLGGIALTPLDGGDGLYDHILLGRSIADLDRTTTATLLNNTAARPLASERLRQLWTDLGSTDELTATSAVWHLVAGRKDALPFLLKSAVVPEKKAPAVDEKTVRPLIERLVHYRHVTRAAASEELIRLGNGVLPHLRKARESATGERQQRLQEILDRWVERTGVNDQRLLRAAAVLAAIGTPEARAHSDRIRKVLP